jgi:hypothetical protein
LEKLQFYMKNIRKIGLPADVQSAEFRKLSEN